MANDWLRQRALRPLVASIAAANIIATTIVANAYAQEQRATPAVVGHRGLGANHIPEPENSIRSIVEALKRGANAVEFDVQLSRDGEVVLAHDVVIDRESEGKGCVNEKTAAELRTFKLRDGSGQIQSDYRGTLYDALKAVTPFDNVWRPFLVLLHLKVYDGDHGDKPGVGNNCPPTKYRALANKSVAIVKSLGLEKRIVFASFDERALQHIKTIDPTLQVGLVWSKDSHPASVAIKKGYDVVIVSKDSVTEEDATLARLAEIPYYVWTLETTEEICKFIAMRQVSGVITDNLSNALQAQASSCYSARR